MFENIALQDLFDLQAKEKHTLIDVRSPKEFQETTIPGSINIPIFTNEERAEVGTLYKKVSKEAAKKRGLEIFSKKLPDFIDSFKQIDTSMTVFCWRGGMRSKTAATVLDLMGIHVNRLEGGIRSYRKWVIHVLGKQDFRPELFVLNGYTGTGKTALLKKLKQNGYPVMDLEGMAGHRGSIFGHIGREPSNQKNFDSALVQTILRYQDEPFVLTEGESKRIGKVLLPDFLYQKKEAGFQIFINLPLNERIKIILDDYQPWSDPETFLEAFRIIKKHIHTPVAKQIDKDLQNENYPNAIGLLLKYYYDPRYEYAIGNYPDDKKWLIDVNHIDEAYEKILQRVKYPVSTS
ncbi:tRNA 2-selenouridine(34) synthase MnmH [Virgibacillus alimentarius]|uniref:tRNA 2-selenouridine synthase n=1 Tax=Virgibacillus alimentarius TaxID=698769 RepID=A0ABS4S7F1_9BACI|nr:tRNA 2-selenouridine(34) synthase MnmH [Virgibacillus alimentarius]MBP2257395.1 tRNA 2-selenouridine synthase [Virgibacillus alimentarius]